MAGPDQIVVTDDVLSAPGATALLAGLPISESSVALRGVAGEVRIYHIDRPR